VPCEIGIAYAFGKPVIGFYAEIRSKRENPGKMYENQFVMGAVETLGEIASSIDQLMKAIPRYSRLKYQTERPYPRISYVCSSMIGTPQ